MKHNVQMIVKYEIKDAVIHQYQQVISDIMDMLPLFEAKQIKLRRSVSEPNQIIESFQLPTEAHYFAMKKLRKSRDHSVFGTLDELIIGGLNKMECLALKMK